MIVDVPGIPLRRRDGAVIYALCDPDDFAWLNQWRWGIVFPNLDTQAGYVGRYKPIEGTKRRVYMHRELLGLEHGDPLTVDHLNGDGLDNRRSNLRVATRAENSQNVVKRSTSSRFRGVTWSKRRKAWIAQLAVAGRFYYGGQYRTEVEAAVAAAALRAEHMPFAVERAGPAYAEIESQGVAV